MHVGLFWEVLQKGLCAPQGETGFVENVGNFFWLVDFFFFFEGMGLCQIFAVAKLLQADGVWSTLFVAHGLSCSGHVGSSRIRDRIRVSCTGGRILYH